jgi:hypothetical protein
VKPEQFSTLSAKDIAGTIRAKMEVTATSTKPQGFAAKIEAERSASAAKPPSPSRS